MAEFRTYYSDRKTRFAGTSIHFTPAYVTCDEKEIEYIENHPMFKRGMIRCEAAEMEQDQVSREEIQALTRGALEEKTRLQLNEVAKAFGVKSFGRKSVDIIDELLSLKEE